MTNLLIGYSITALVFTIKVARNEMKQSHFKWEYLLGTLIAPSISYGLYHFQANISLPDSHTKKYELLQWMWKIHLMILILGLIPYQGAFYLLSLLEEVFQPNNAPISDYADLYARMTEYALKGIASLLILVAILFKIIGYMILTFIFVIIPRLMRPAY